MKSVSNTRVDADGLTGGASSEIHHVENSLTDNRWALLVTIGTMLVTMIPYLIGLSFAGTGASYTWLGYNIDDSCVYLSWMRQAADGSSRALNLFTTDQQHGMLLNPLFLVLGHLAGIVKLPLIAVYHSSRMVFGAILLLLVWRLITATVANPAARRLPFLFVAFASGLGWLSLWWSDSPFNTPIDKWQPEAITFLSLYLSPLFCFSMALQVGILLLLFQGERTGKMRMAVAAGLLGLVLGLVHSYDVISLSAVWVSYVAYRLVSNKSNSTLSGSSTQTLLRAAVAGILSAPGVGYIYLQFRNEPVFRARAEVATLSAPIVWLLLGYGITLALAVWGAIALRSARNSDATNVDERPVCNPEASAFLILWAIVNVVVSYLPHVPFQRKVLQGAHFPIAILGGIGAWFLLKTLTRKAAGKHVLVLRIAPALMILVLSLTNVRFMLRDITNDERDLAQTNLQRPYLLNGEVEALNWIKDNTPDHAAIQPLPWLTVAGNGSVAPFEMTVACFTPGTIGRPVYCGHWGETPDFSAKLFRVVKLELPNTSDDERVQLLRDMNVRYLLFSQKRQSDSDADRLAPMFRGRLPIPHYLSLVHTNTDADVYSVNLPSAP